MGFLFKVNPIEKCQKSKIVSEKLAVVGQFFNGVFNTGVGDFPHLINKEEKMSNEIRFLTRKQVCEALQISRVTFWKLQKTGFLPPTYLIGKAPRWSIDCLEELLKLKPKK